MRGSFIFSRRVASSAPSDSATLMAVDSVARPCPPRSAVWNSAYFSGIIRWKAIETTLAFCESGLRIGNSLSTKRRSGSDLVSACMSSMARLQKPQL